MAESFQDNDKIWLNIISQVHKLLKKKHREKKIFVLQLLLLKCKALWLTKKQNLGAKISFI